MTKYRPFVALANGARAGGRDTRNENVTICPVSKPRHFEAARGEIIPRHVDIRLFSRLCGNFAT